jgi:peptidyl-prolyl cis-trans isomerase A (cyclophilin A)
MNASLSSKFLGMRKLAAVAMLPPLAALLAVPIQAAGEQSGQSPAPKAASGQGTTAKKAPAAARPSYDRALLRPALLKEIAPDTYKVKFSTTRGDFTVTVTRAWSPLGADRFWNLVKHHFYDNASVFRVVPGFVAQFGISAYPAVSKAWADANIKDEPVVQGNKRGYLTYAKTSQPNTRSTQLFINLKDNSQGLDRQGFSAFGVVDDPGMKVVDMFYDQYDSTGIDQSQIESQGKTYLDKSFPKLDTIKTVVITEPAQPSVPAKPAAAKPATATKKPQ